MITTRIESVSTTNLSDTYRTSNGIGLCYFDPRDELLKEFHPSVSLPIYPGESTKRQFYIVKDDVSLLLNVVTFRASVEDADYKIKSSLNFYEDFNEVEENNSVVAFFSQYVSNIIPITVYIENAKDTVEDVTLEIDLEIV